MKIHENSLSTGQQMAQQMLVDGTLRNIYMFKNIAIIFKYYGGKPSFECQDLFRYKTLDYI